MSGEWIGGGCHCGRVRFQVRVTDWIADECNCTVCSKKGLLHLIVPPEHFVLEAGADALTTYRFHTGVARHTFCSTCGVQSFYTPRSHPDMVDVNVRCLDGEAPGRFRIEPFDGVHWEEGVGELRARHRRGASRGRGDG